MSSVATCILKSNKIVHAAENQRYSSMRRTPSGIADFEDARRKLSAKQHGQPIEAGKGKKKKKDCTLEYPERYAALYFSSVRPILDFGPMR